MSVVKFPLHNIRPYIRPFHIKTLPAGSFGWGKITENIYPNPLGFNRQTDSRFSDPRPRAYSRRYGIIYFAENFETCFTETLIRDELVDKETKDIRAADLARLIYVPIKLHADLKLLDLTHGNFLPLHIHSDTLRGENQAKAQKLALQIFLNRHNFDGILFESRFTSDHNLALFDRALGKITHLPPLPLAKHKDFSLAEDKYLLEIFI